MNYDKYSQIKFFKNFKNFFKFLKNELFIKVVAGEIFLFHVVKYKYNIKNRIFNSNLLKKL